MSLFYYTFLAKIICQETDSLVSLERRRVVSVQEMKFMEEKMIKLMSESLFTVLLTRAYFTRDSALESLEHLVVSFPVRGKGKKKWDDDDSCHPQHESRQEQELPSRFFNFSNFKRIRV